MALRAMKQVALTLVLLLSIAAPTVAAAPLAEDTDHLSSYSIAVQHAFNRCDSSALHDGEWLLVGPFEGEPTLLAGAFLVDISASEVQHLLASGVAESACPQIERQHTARWWVDDPRFDDQWHLDNTGQSGGVINEDANVTGVWDVYNGTGVAIGIVDDGLQHDHPDLSANYLSSNDWDYCGSDGNPYPSNSHAHGTAAAGVAAATGDNAEGGAGAAPDADLAGFRLIACGNSDSMEAQALSHDRQIIDIYSNSWGPSDDGSTLEAPGPLMVAAFESDVSIGRGGLGNIITWAAGNGLQADDNSNYDGYANMRQTIAVTAISHNGDQSYYAEPGANILVAAHSNGDGEGITTTDNQGGAGYTNSDYTDTFGGTSSATPLVSGVIALMLEANANLTWRDVQHIIVNSARMNDPTDASWSVNGAGHDVSHKYGFGAMDAGAAVALAENWTGVDAAENITSGLRSPGLAIPDNNGVAVTDTYTVTEKLSVEHVEVFVNISHTYRSDLEIILTSPSGTQSVLAEEHSDGSNNFHDWMFSTVHNWDELSTGDWTLSVEDVSGGDSGTFDDWELVIAGVPVDPDSDLDGISDANETDVYGTDPFDNDTDGDSLLDPYELFTLGTDPLDPDTDNDGLWDGVEVLVNGTDPLDNDTDDDGLSDGAEVNFWQTDPLSYDADADNDTWYWFGDCNDSNPAVHPDAIEVLNGIDDNCDGEWDEGFNFSDADLDGLSDWNEYHVYGTGPTVPDSDGDGLTDGEEVLTHQTDPLVPDADADNDTWYWFQDCNDTNASLNPDMPELLDGLDNDCDTEVDEDFLHSDSDGDGVLDLVEYNQLGTNPFLPDTDGDGLSDGEELYTTHTDPLVYDGDADGDGFRWFEECDDTNPAIRPDAIEFWNGFDDDCDGDIDEEVDRASYLNPMPSRSVLVLNATTDTLALAVGLQMDENTTAALNLSSAWYLNGTPLTAVGWAFNEGPWDCTIVSVGVCAGNGTLAPMNYTIVLTEGEHRIVRTWWVTWEVYHPPPPEPEPEPEPDPEVPTDGGDDEEKTADGFEVDGQLALIGGLALLVAALLLLVLIIGRGGRPPERAPPHLSQFHGWEAPGHVPGMPPSDLPSMNDAFAPDLARQRRL